MIASVNLETGGIEPIEVSISDLWGQPLLGATNIKAKVRRNSDLKYFDWSDNTFRSAGSVVQILEVLSPVSSVHSKGEYFLNTALHPKGWDTSKITNPVADDVYHITVIEDGSAFASNLPQVGEIKVGRWVDLIDVATSTRATPTDVAQALIAIGLDHLLVTDPGATPPAVNTYIRQILDKVDELLLGGNVVEVKQSYGYDPTTQTLTGQVWAEKSNTIEPATSASITWYDSDGTSLFTISSSTPDTQDVFKLVKASPRITRYQSYYSVATVAMPGLGNVISGKGALTVG